MSADKNDMIVNYHDISSKVLDVTQFDFSNSVTARKKPTLVRKAMGGEKIETRNKKGEIESVDEASPGEAIFINMHNENDMYVPADSDGTRWQFDELQSKGYETQGEDLKRDAVIVQNIESFKILPNAIQEPSCIQNAWGEGEHQFLFAGAALKQDKNGRITGIDKDAFDQTWDIIAATNCKSFVEKPKPSGL